MADTNPPTSKRVYGRRKGRPLRVRKTQLMKTFFPSYQIVLKEGERISLQDIFQTGTPASVWMEIGFGGGEHLAAQAQLHPDIHFIGCEPFVNGVASLMDHLERSRIVNVRVYNDDARCMLDALPEASIERCFILFADPWPKKRHTERRFIGGENLNRLARVLKPSGLLRLASDHPQLVEWMRAEVAGHGMFTCVYDSVTAPRDWVPTRYQEKAATAGRQPVFMDFRRR